jgi:NAD(P)-dependent dehydrogenase (short-subunit alcohol dehydrogenase family)
MSAMSNSRMCEGRVCIVTGGGRGLGRSYSTELAAHGALVVVNDLGAGRDGTGADTGPAHQVVAQIVAAGGQAVANGDDVSTWDGAARLVHQAIDSFGRLDVLVNNAGILRDGMLCSMSEDDWDDVIRVHLKGTFATSRHAAVHWRALAKAGQELDARLINTSSMSGLYANVGQSNYGAAKAGIAAFTQIAAQELGRYGVTVNAIAPGAMTRMTEDLDLPAEMVARFDPRWSAHLVAWLASPQSAGVTGQVIESSGMVLAVAEGWRRGPSAEPLDDAAALDPVVRELLARALPRTTVADVT